MVVGVLAASRLDAFEKSLRRNRSSTAAAAFRVCATNEHNGEGTNAGSTCGGGEYGGAANGAANDADGDLWEIQLVVWVAFGALTLIHAYANWRGVTALRLRTLNRHRFTLLLARFRENQGLKEKLQLELLKPLRPNAIAAVEAEWRQWMTLPFRITQQAQIRLGVRLSDLAFGGTFTCDDIDEFRTACQLGGQEEKYVLTCSTGIHTKSDGDLAQVRCAFLVGACALDELKGFHHALILLEDLTNDAGRHSSVQSTMHSSPLPSQGERVKNKDKDGTPSMHSGSYVLEMAKMVTAAKLKANTEWTFLLRAIVKGNRQDAPTLATPTKSQSTVPATTTTTTATALQKTTTAPASASGVDAAACTETVTSSASDKTDDSGGDGDDDDDDGWLLSRVVIETGTWRCSFVA